MQKKKQKMYHSSTESRKIHSLRTQTYFRLSLVSAEKYVFFGGDKQQPEIGLRSQAKRIKNLPICTCHSDLSTLPGVLSSQFSGPILLLAVFHAVPQLTERLSSDFKLEVCGWPCCKTWNKEKKGRWLEKWNEIAGSKSKRFLQNVSKASEWLVSLFKYTI